MKTVLITGGAGFIGSHLCDLFLREGHRVLCLDNFITGDEENIAHLASNKDFSLIRHDVTTPITLEEDVDFILHFASPASPVDYLNHPIETLKAGAMGTLNCLELTRRNGAVFFLASTSEVYGDPQVHPQVESYWGHVNPVGPRSVYDEAKRYAEALTMAYHRQYRLDTRIVRIFNTYGPRMRLRDGRAIPNFFTQALCGESITIYGDGSQTRSFCYVGDLVRGIYKLLASGLHDPVNLGNPVETTVKVLAEEIVRLAASKSKLIYKPLPKDDPRQRRPDIGRAREGLDWQPKVGLSEGLAKTIGWFRSRC